MQILSLLPLPLIVLANLIELTSCHYIDNALALALVEPTLPASSIARSSDKTPFWTRLHSYLIGQSLAHAEYTVQNQANGNLLQVTLRLLAALTRFDRGRFARTIVQNIPWNSKCIAKASSSKTDHTKSKSSKGKKASSITFASPDLRLTFCVLILSVLHPAEISTASNPKGLVESGAATATKMLLLSPEQALGPVSSMLSGLPEDHPEVALHVLKVFEHSVFSDPRYPKGSLVALVKTTNLLNLILDLSNKWPQHQEPILHTLYELCTHPGRGICFRDRGFYGRPSSEPDMLNVGLSSEDAGLNGDLSAVDTLTVTSPQSTYNPLLSYFIQSRNFSPLYNESHRTLLLAILRAVPELQPVITNSSKSSFGGGRLEPPHVSQGANTADASGARLSGLLANRLMGLILDLELPAFNRDQALPLHSLITATIPSTLTRSNMSRGLRHPDRLVRWSTLDLFVRLLGRVVRTLDVCERWSQDEPAWAKAGEILLKAISKKLPDLSALTSIIEDLPSRQKKQAAEESFVDTAAPPTPDWIFLEISLRSILLYLTSVHRRYGSACVAVSQYTTQIDVRKLLSASYLTTDTASNGADFLKPMVQIHSLKIIRFCRLQLTTAAAAAGHSPLKQVIDLSLSPEVASEVRIEAARLISDAFESAANPRDGQGISSLVFEGDVGELEAWVAALASPSGSSNHHHRSFVIQLIEECLSRCSKNVYRYLEAARGLENTQKAPKLQSALTGVSPLFAAFIEQVQIKVSKDLFPSAESRREVIQYLRRLMPLLLARNRPGACARLLEYHDSLVKALIVDSSHLTPAEKTMLLEIPVVMPIDRQPDRGYTPGRRKAPINLDAIGPDDPLLEDPLTLNLERVWSSSMRLLHLLRLMQVGDNLSLAAIDTAFSAEEINCEGGALDKLSLSVAAIILAHCAHKEIQPARLSIKAVAKIASKENPTTIDTFFFSLPQVSLAMRDRKLVEALANAVGPSFASQDVELFGGLQSLLSEIIATHGICDTTEQLIPLMGSQALESFSVASMRCLEATDDASTAAKALHTLRQIRILQADLPSTGKLDLVELRRYFCAAERFSTDCAVLTETVALLCLLLDVTDYASPAHSRADEAAQCYLPVPVELSVRNLRWLSPELFGGDLLFAKLLRRFSDVPGHFAHRLKADQTSLARTIERLPLATRAWLDGVLACGQSLDNALVLIRRMVAPLAGLLFHKDPARSQLGGDCLGIAIKLHDCRASQSSATNAILELLLAAIPEQPSEAFQVGAVRLASNLALDLAHRRDVRTLLCGIVETMIERSLSWLVRRFAEDEEDSDDFLVTIAATASLFYTAARKNLAQLKSYLAEPVIEILIRRRLAQRQQRKLLQSVVASTKLTGAATSRFLASLLAHPQFRTLTKKSESNETECVAESSSRLEVLSLVHMLASRHPLQSLPSQTLQALSLVYGGTLSLSDRLIFDLLMLTEESQGREALSGVISAWSGDSSLRSSDGRSALGALLSLDNHRALATCTHFKRERCFEYLSLGAGGKGKDDDDVVTLNAYDPLWVLWLFVSALNEEQHINGLQWLAIVRTNALGVVICCLSSKNAQVRMMGLTALARAYLGIEKADVQEKEHLLLGLDAVKSSVRHSDSETLTPLPLTTTLFLAQHLRLIGSPSSYLYPIFTRFLLQRPKFDTSDVPMLYSMLQSTNPESWRLQRVWMLRFLRDVVRGGGATLEWRVLKRRYVWELLASMYSGMRRTLSSTQTPERFGGRTTYKSIPTIGNSTSSARQTMILIRETMLAAARIPEVAMDLLCRKAFLSWISQQMSMDKELSSYLQPAQLAENKARDIDEATNLEEQAFGGDTNLYRCFWLLLLWQALMAVQDLTRLDRATSGTWQSRVVTILDLHFASFKVRPAETLERTEISHALEILELIVRHSLSPVGRGAQPVNFSVAFMERVRNVVSQLLYCIRSGSEHLPRCAKSFKNAGLAQLSARIVEFLLIEGVAEGNDGAALFSRAVALTRSFEGEDARQDESFEWVRRESLRILLSTS